MSSDNGCLLSVFSAAKWAWWASLARPFMQMNRRRNAQPRVGTHVDSFPSLPCRQPAEPHGHTPKYQELAVKSNSPPLPRFMSHSLIHCPYHAGHHGQHLGITLGSHSWVKWERVVEDIVHHSWEAPLSEIQDCLSQPLPGTAVAPLGNSKQVIDAPFTLCFSY